MLFGVVGAANVCRQVERGPLDCPAPIQQGFVVGAFPIEGVVKRSSS